MKCKDCKWWEGTENLFGKGTMIEGKCKRYPKSVEKHEEDFCGEFEPKKGFRMKCKETIRRLLCFLGRQE